MIKGIGVDVLEIARIERTYIAHPERFVSRILTTKEKVEYGRRKNKANYLAKQFAAKEAIAKSFGTGIGAISFNSIEVLRTEQGQPIVKILASADERFRFGHVHLSLSDTGNLVTAFAVYESD